MHITTHTQLSIDCACYLLKLLASPGNTSHSHWCLLLHIFKVNVYNVGNVPKPSLCHVTWFNISDLAFANPTFIVQNI